VSYETEEQQIEQLKEWWKDNGTPLIVGAVLGLSGFFGWKFWNEKQIATQEAASYLYMTVSEQVGKEDTAKLVENAAKVKSSFPDSSYAIFSAFHLAKHAVENNQLDDAITELTWVIDKHPANELVQIAKIRLARILVAQQKAEQAYLY
jgi:predicted negative regulator of RcsB-dependent stress response